VRLKNVGISALLDENKEDNKKLIGTLVYNAPEVTSNSGDPRSDI
jgi:serine/threonine protein kinase